MFRLKRRRCGDATQAKMFHKAVNLEFKEGTRLEMTFQDGSIKSYDISSLFGKYPSLEALKDRTLFLKGRLMGGYGIVWNDELDIEAETIYEDGVTVKRYEGDINVSVADTLIKARAESALTQKELSLASGINQADISKLERGIGNPSLKTLARLANAMGKTLKIEIS